jgi:hypothetical protein
MAHTDVHRPWRVQCADPTNRHLIRRYGESRGEPLYTSHRNLGCGCHLCTGQQVRKLARRQERVQWRTERQRALADPDADLRPIRRKAW